MKRIPNPLFPSVFSVNVVGHQNRQTVERRERSAVFARTLNLTLPIMVGGVDFYFYLSRLRELEELLLISNN